MSGRMNLNAMERPLGCGLVADGLAHGAQDARRAGQVLVLERVRERRVEPGDPGDGRLEREEAALLDERRELRAEAAGSRRLVHDDDAAGLPDGRGDGFDVERLQRAEVDHLAVDALRLRLARGEV